MAVPKLARCTCMFFWFSFRISFLSLVYCSTGILRHLTVVRTSSLFGHVTKPAPAPVNIEKLQEEAQKVSGKEVVNFFVFVFVVNLV